MKKILIDSLYYYENYLKYAQTQIDADKASLAKYKSERSRKQREFTIDRQQRAITETTEKLNTLQNELKTAEAQFTNNDIITLVECWTDENGRTTDIRRDKTYTNFKDALAEYHKLKQGNGAYVEIHFEIRPKQEQERIEELETKIAQLQHELEELRK